MKILALEFSSRERSVALQGEGGLRVTAMETGGRAAHAFELVERALAQARLEREQIECLAVGLGPGSYTGIRAAIAVAQGWQLAQPVKLVGVGSADCLAVQAQQAGWFGKVNIAIDAQRNEFYLARYQIDTKERREIAPLILASIEEVAALVKAGEIVAGPAADKLFAGARPLFPKAETVALLAAGRNDFVAGEKLEPVYLRETNFIKAPPPRIPAGG